MDPQTLQMLAALQAQQPGMAAQQPQMNALQQQAMPQNPLMNGMNASLGASGGNSLGTPQDMYAAMMQAPPMGAGY